MSMREPLTVYRPDKTDNDDGTYDESAPDPTSTVWGTITIHKGETMLTVDRFEELLPEDTVKTEDGAEYRVLNKERTLNAAEAQFKLQRQTRPIHPTT